FPSHPAMFRSRHQQPAFQVFRVCSTKTAILRTSPKLISNESRNNVDEISITIRKRPVPSKRVRFVWSASDTLFSSDDKMYLPRIVTDNTTLEPNGNAITNSPKLTSPDSALLQSC